MTRSLSVLMFIAIFGAIICQSQQAEMPQLSQAGPCHTQQHFNPATNRVETIDCHHRVIVSAAAPVSTSGAPAPVTNPIDEGAIESSLSLQQAKDKYDVWVLDYNRKIFEYQNWYGVIIFIMVNVLVVAGLWFAWIQFKSTLHLSHHVQSATKAAVADGGDSADAANAQPAASNPDPAAANAATQLKIGMDGVAISSSFIGLIILGFSMGFYFLYLQYVYPIRNVQPPVPAVTEPAASH